MCKKLFERGQLVFTMFVNDAVADSVEMSKGVIDSLSRHFNGDWGEVPVEDKEANDQALGDGTRLFSAYSIGDRKIWIITEADRSATTVLFPEEY